MRRPAVVVCPTRLFHTIFAVQFFHQMRIKPNDDNVANDGALSAHVKAQWPAEEFDLIETAHPVDRHEGNERAKRFEIGVKALGRMSRLAHGFGINLDTFSVSDDVELRIIGEFDKPI